MKHSDQPATFGQRLRWLRNKHGLSLAQFGKLVKVGRSYLSKLENGKSQNASEEFLFSVCDAFDLQWDWLLKGEGKPFLVDGLNAAAENGQLLPPYVLPTHPERAVFFDACFVAGTALTLNPTARGIAAILLKLIENRTYTEPLRMEVARILLTELIARLSKPEFIACANDEPVSELGKAAVAAVSAVKEQSQRKKKPLAIDNASDNIAEVKAQWPLLKARLQKATQATGSKTRLAEFLGVKLSNVSLWLMDDSRKSAREPGAETALRMLRWVEQQERAQ